jgi:molybdate transport system ATP-binding protein
LAETSATKMAQAAQSTLAPAFLSVRMRHRIGALEVDVDFRLDKPWTILFGPSGSGKTTILRAIAGLIRPDRAVIQHTMTSAKGAATSVVFEDRSAKARLAPYRRGIGYAPQEASLFPHMTVLGNVVYGARNDIGEEAARNELVESILGLLRISSLTSKYPAQLSGGEAQRVNLARALATAVAGSACRLILLDEPFPGIEAVLRDEIIGDVTEWLNRRRIPVLSVTHDVAEAFQLGAEVIKIADGRVVEQGPVGVVLADERARLLAQLNGDRQNPA